MATVLWRPEINALTTPQSWRPRYLPRDTNGSDNLAARIAQKHSSLDEEMVKTTITALVEEIQIDLINGNQSALTDAFTFRLSLNARLDAPDDPLPPVEELVRIKVSASRSFVEAVRQDVHLERMPMSKKMPLITAAEDTVLKLNDVLNPNGALHLSGSDLVFDQEDEDCGCVLEGTRSGRTVQSRFVAISDTEITFLPDIPPQNEPWNNEYILSVSTQYTENGTLRTGIYERRLRTPLLIDGFQEGGAGILTGAAYLPYVSVMDGVLTANETLRIQAILDIHEGWLLFNLIDMSKGGKTGEAVKVTTDGEYVLQGFSGSAVSSLEVTVSNYADLVKMIRSNYSGRLVDVLEIKQGS